MAVERSTGGGSAVDTQSVDSGESVGLCVVVVVSSCLSGSTSGEGGSGGGSGGVIVEWSQRRWQSTAAVADSCSRCGPRRMLSVAVERSTGGGSAVDTQSVDSGVSVCICGSVCLCVFVSLCLCVYLDQPQWPTVAVGDDLEGAEGHRQREGEETAVAAVVVVAVVVLLLVTVAPAVVGWQRQLRVSLSVAVDRRG